MRMRKRQKEMRARVQAVRLGGTVRRDHFEAWTLSYSER